MSCGLLGVPRLSVWFVPQPLVNVGVEVGDPPPPVICIGQAIVDCKIWVLGLAMSVVKKVCIVAGVRALDAPIALRPVASAPVPWSRPATFPCLSVTWLDVPDVNALSTFCSYVAGDLFACTPGWVAMPSFCGAPEAADQFPLLYQAASEVQALQE